MELKLLYTWIGLLLSIIICKLSQCSAKPIIYDLDNYEYDRYDRSYDRSKYDTTNSYAVTYGKPLASDHVHRLSTGYYYVDSGYIVPLPGSSSSSRQRTLRSDGSEESYKFSPIVRYKKTRTDRKKLFVPNFFG